MSATTEITVVTPIRHPRLKYALRIIGEELGYRFGFRERPGQPRLEYGGDGNYNWPAHPFLSGKTPRPADLIPQTIDGLPTFFITPQGPDLLSCIFFVLSRFEEYENFTPDTHGRFPAAASHAYRYGYLERPIVREWIAKLGQRLSAWFPELPPPRQSPFYFQPTYDIDLLWAYHYRGWRGWASGLRDTLTGKFGRARDRLVSDLSSDPFNTIDRLEALHDKYQLRAEYFWLLATGADRRDPNPYPIPPAQYEIIRQLDAKHLTGIHPSYHANDHPELIEKELTGLSGIINRKSLHSRQHFLRLTFPNTYRQLLRAGITNDHTMGYADAVGWRAGTNRPFFWYDLRREKMTAMRVHPFAAMDVTLKNYLGLSGGAAGKKIMELAGAIRPLGGPFALLWHNSSFAERFGWEGWGEVYEDTLRALVDFSSAGSE